MGYFAVCHGEDFFFFDNGLHNPASTSRDVHSQKVQTKTGLGKQAKLKNS
jgi:hypothetical protein